ncbi:MAG: hypothetical protein MJ252_00050, partial [archaeon]|nr:hypothetical protein [archaeon]
PILNMFPSGLGNYIYIAKKRIPNCCWRYTIYFITIIQFIGFEELIFGLALYGIKKHNDKLIEENKEDIFYNVPRKYNHYDDMDIYPSIIYGGIAYFSSVIMGFMFYYQIRKRRH